MPPNLIQVKQIAATTTVGTPGVDTLLPTEKAVRDALDLIGSVTGGDAHDHSGGDGAQIAYSGLSGLPPLGTLSAENSPLVLANGGTGADISAAQNGQVYKNGTVLSTRLDNLAATSDPTTTNDTAQNYSVGSRWINTSTKGEWVCLDATSGAARWHKTSRATAFRQSIFTRFISPMLEALTWTAAQIFQASVTFEALATVIFKAAVTFQSTAAATFQSTISQVVTSSGAGSTFNQGGTGDITAFQDAGVSTVRVLDQGGVALVPQAGGFQSVAGLLGYDSEKKRLVLYHETHNYPVPIDPRNTCRNNIFTTTY